MTVYFVKFRLFIRIGVYKYDSCDYLADATPVVGLLFRSSMRKIPWFLHLSQMQVRCPGQSPDDFPMLVGCVRCFFVLSFFLEMNRSSLLEIEYLCS